MTTQRSMSAILALLADNVAGDISAEDMRDAIESLRPRFGKMAVQAADAASVTIGTVSTYVEVTEPTWTVSGVATGSPSPYGFDMDSNGRLRYTGAEPVVANVGLSVAVTSASSNQVIHYRLGKNGATSVNSEGHRKIGTGADVGAISIAGIFELDTNDYLSLFVSNESGSNDITIETAQLQAMAFTL